MRSDVVGVGVADEDFFRPALRFPGVQPESQRRQVHPAAIESNCQRRHILHNIKLEVRKGNFKLALVQMRVEGGRKQENLRHAVDMIRQAAAGGATVVLLPEAMPLGWTHTSALTDADEIPEGLSCSLLRQAAQQNLVYVCAGLVERAGDKIFNAAVLISPQGKVILCHRKMNELDIGRHLYAPGDRLQVALTPYGRFGIMICADGFAPGQAVSRALAQMGAQIILSPSSWAVPAEHDNQQEPYGTLWLDNYCPVAREYGVWIASVSNVGWLTDGPWQGRKCIGCSLVVGPTGEPVVTGPYGQDAETILYVDVQLAAP